MLSVQPGSLVRLVGSLSDDGDPADGGAVLRAVTMADSERIRR